MRKLKPLLSSVAGIAGPQTDIEAPHVALAECRPLRDLLASKYDEATSFAYPGRRGISHDAEATQAYDSTAVTAAPEFASRIQSGVCPPFSRWASHMAGILVTDADEKKEIEADLEQIDDYVFELINGSNFQTEINEALQDLALGTGAIEVEEGDDDEPLVVSAIPTCELLFGIGPDGRPDPIARVRRMKARDIRFKAPLATLPKDIDTSKPLEVAVIHQRDWSEPAAHRYRCTWFLPANGNAVIWQYEVSGRGACPAIVFRWSKSSGEAWGRGPLLQCLPDMRVTNYAVKAVIDHAELALAGIWTAEDDGVINTETVRLEAGILVPRAPGSQPLQNVAPNGNFDMTQFMLEEHRGNIKRALFNEQLGNPNKTPMSATEVDQRMAELARAIGAPFGRIVAEMVLPFIRRVHFILKARKLIEAPEADGKEIKLLPTGPLAQGQRLEDIDRTVKFVGTVGQLFGPEAAALTIDPTETSEYLGDRFGVPARIRRPRKKQEAMAQEIAAAAQGGMNGEGSEQPIA